MRRDCMFNLFRKKLPQPAPCAERHWFISELFDKVRQNPVPEKRLEGYINLWKKIRGLESEFDVHCFELELARDEIEDAFYECSDPNTLCTCLIAYGVLQDKLEIVTEVIYGNLPDHLKARLIKTYIRAEIEQLNVDTKELDPALQYAFYEVEQRKLSVLEKAQILESEFGIKGWRSEREMNPQIIYD